MRTPERSFWLAQDRLRRFAWGLVRSAAALGKLIAAAPRPLEGAVTIEEAVERYVERGAACDRAHRRFEQEMASRLEPQLPHFGALQEVVQALRRRHRDWADLAAIGSLDEAALQREAGKSPLVIVHGTEIEKAGGAGVGLATFEKSLRDVRSAALRLRQAGVTRFVFTADHGFFLADATTAVVRFGKCGDSELRFVLASEKRAEPGLAAVSLAELGYEGGEGWLLLREDTAVFETGKARKFVHGGNSLEERVIPVLTVARAMAAGTAAYRLEAERRTGSR